MKARAGEVRGGLGSAGRTGCPTTARRGGALAGHLWTLGVRLGGALRPPEPPPFVPWRGCVADPVIGSVRLSGRWSEVPGARVAFIVVHGLGGSAASHYAVRAAGALMAAGGSVLALNLRGAEGAGNDFYHAGLTADLAAAVAAPELANAEAIALLGFSLGGHLALRYATEVDDERVRAVAAVCPPLDLEAGCRAIDRAALGLYRTYVLRHLKELYRGVARRAAVPTPVERTDRARGLREWDGLTVAPRHGFASAEDYYRRMSAGPVLDRLRIAALVVAAEWDPMIPASTLRPFLDPPPGRVEVRWAERGGHLAFPADLDLGLDGGLPRPAGGYLPQIVGWLRQRLDESPGSALRI